MMVPRNKLRFNKSTSFVSCYRHLRYRLLTASHHQAIFTQYNLYHEGFLWLIHFVCIPHCCSTGLLLYNVYTVHTVTWLYNSPVTDLFNHGHLCFFELWITRENAFPVGKEYDKDIISILPGDCCNIIIHMSVIVQVWSSPWWVLERHQERI